MSETNNNIKLSKQEVFKSDLLSRYAELFISLKSGIYSGYCFFWNLSVSIVFSKKREAIITSPFALITG